MAPKILQLMKELPQMEEKFYEYNQEQKRRIQQFNAKMAKRIVKDDGLEANNLLELDTTGLRPIRPFDSRFEITNLTLGSEENQRIVANSFSTLGVLHKDQLRRTSEGFEVRQIKTLEDCFSLCSDEPYIMQPVLCAGTAFLLSRNVVMTARHNLDNIPLNKMAFVIGYRIDAVTTTANTTFESSVVYHAKTILHSTTLENLDLVLIKLDRNLAAGVPLSIETQSKIELHKPVYALGHPVGLPMKYITNASVKSLADDYHFYTSLDTFSGNSGSPVFLRESHQVIGVLVDGGTDFRFNGNCNVSNLCGSDCLGERVVNLVPLRDHINQIITFHEN